jgi:hypothetical protein
MTDHHEYDPDRYRQIPGSEYGDSASGTGVLVALAAIALFFGALLMFAGTPADDGEQTAARQPAPVERPFTEPAN